MVLHTQDHQTLRTTLIITLNHDHLIIIEMEIVHDDHSHVIIFVTSENISTRFQTKYKQTIQCPTLEIQTQKMSPRKHSSNNNLMIYF